MKDPLEVKNLLRVLADSLGSGESYQTVVDAAECIGTLAADIERTDKALIAVCRDRPPAEGK